MKFLIVLVLLVGVPGWSSERLIGSCYWVKGRLSYYNGTPSTRIWIVGTHRILGVPSEDSELPANVKSLLKNFDDSIYAEFEVCPITEERTGEMRMVLVKSAKNAVNRPTQSK